MDFSEAIAKFSEDAKRRVQKARFKIALEVFSLVILRTPVGYPPKWKRKPPKGYVGGHARANWQVSNGAPASGVVAGTDKNSAIQALAPTIQMNNSDDSIFLTNNLPYIDRLENGWSRQAPVGMVGITVAEFSGIAAKVVQEVSRE